jgi:hypothetical protein
LLVFSLSHPKEIVTVTGLVPATANHHSTTFVEVDTFAFAFVNQPKGLFPIERERTDI